MKSPSRRLALIVLCAMQLMIILDGTIVTVALPTIQDQLGFTQPGLAWVMNAYLIAFAGLLLLAGRLGDLLGVKRVFIAGVAVFTLASLLCGLAESSALLIAGRTLQGVGAALASAVILGMIVKLFPAPAEQAKAMAIYSFTAAGGGAIGLLAGGVITQTIGWHWAFLVNVPIGALALVLATRLFAADRGPGLGRGADILGAALVTAGLSLGIAAIVTTTILYGLAAAALLVAFVIRQARAAQPLVPLRVFGNRTLSGANLATILLFAAGFGFQFLTALYLQRVLGFDSLQTGLAFLPGPLVIGVISLFAAAPLTARFGVRTVLLTGLSAIAVALILLSRAPVDGDYLVEIMPVLALMGLGMGLAIPALIMRAMSGARPADAGLASGLTNTAQQVGAALGTAVIATMATLRTDTLIGQGVATVTAERDGYSLAFLIAAGFVVAAIAVAAFYDKATDPTPIREEAERERTNAPNPA
ncbi:MFS transporter [Nonomuraea sp. NPDC050547]|uniref:MFS transporter n=1 Tax=Nonomuraea sp. NPDC050547 TaxID=3364368 RepID=UPI0037987E32